MHDSCKNAIGLNARKSSQRAILKFREESVMAMWFLPSRHPRRVGFQEGASFSSSPLSSRLEQAKNRCTRIAFVENVIRGKY